jgi:hypothetical protein
MELHGLTRLDNLCICDSWVPIGVARFYGKLILDATMLTCIVDVNATPRDDR